MNWRLKAAIQNAIACVPAGPSNRVYHWLQRTFGSLGKRHSSGVYKNSVKVAALVESYGRSIAGSTILEIGTGTNIRNPLSFWLMGAERVITVDLNRYLRKDVISDDLEYIKNHRNEVKQLLADRMIDDRWTKLVTRANQKWNIDDILELCHIEYLAPCDAAKLSIESETIDLHLSHVVFEHIPGETILAILREGKRVLKPSGLSVHLVDFTDHFVSADRRISPINFLQFSDADWHRIAHNRFNYVNRLRVDDLENLFRIADLHIAASERQVDPVAQEMLITGAFHVDARFSKKSPEVLATTNAWITATKDA